GAVGVVNLEGPLAAGAGGARVEGGRVWLANPAGAPAFLRAQGVWAASIANNHAADDGEAGVARTAAGLRDAGVVPVGRAPARLDVGGVPVRLFAYDLGGDAGVPEGMARDLAGVDDVAVVAFHVTGPPSYLPRAELVAAVDAAVAGGADIVVAHGTHVVGPVERRGETVIAWGLGNLLFDCECTDHTDALVLRVELTAGRPAEIVPVTAGLGGAPATLAAEPDGVLDLVAGLGGTPIARVGGRGRF
ncbi:MAG: CapA family protein, partial [Myxococcota bacterium]